MFYEYVMVFEFSLNWCMLEIWIKDDRSESSCCDIFKNVR